MSIATLRLFEQSDGHEAETLVLSVPVRSLAQLEAAEAVTELVRALHRSSGPMTLIWDLEAERGELDLASSDVADGFAVACRWLSTLVRTRSRAVVRLVPDIADLSKAWDSITPSLTLLPLEPGTAPEPVLPPSWDKLVDPWVDFMPSHGEKVPSAYRVWLVSRRYFKAGDFERARRCEELNYVLHNSFVPCRLDLEGEVIFAYGGIGVILHKDAHIHPGVTIGANVTIGGNGSSVRLDTRTGRGSTVPEIGELVTIGAGAHISGGIVVGSMAIVAPNAVVTKDVQPGAIVGGVPSRVLGHVTVENALRYRAKYLPARTWDDERFMSTARRLLGKVAATDQGPEGAPIDLVH